jgi:hypothetical protein
LAGAQTPEGAFTTSVIDTDQDTATITVGGDGLGLVAYARGVDHGLTVAHCEDPACSRVTATALGGPGSAWDLAIATGSDGRGLISTTDLGTATVIVRHCADAACSAVTSTTVDTTDLAGYGGGVAIGPDGLGLIAYWSAGLKVAHCNDLACSGVTTTFVEAGNTPAIAIGADGRALIAYKASASGGPLKVAHCNDAACTSFTTAVIGTTSFVLGDVSIAMGADGLALIAHEPAFAVMAVAHCTDVPCSSATTVPLGDGHYPSVVRGRGGLGVITYGTVDLGVRVLHCQDAGCGSFVTGRIDTSSWEADTAAVLGADGELLVAYDRRIGGDWTLRVAHQAPRGDFDVDGRQDLVWRNAATGENQVWLMNGADRVSVRPTEPSTLADTRWRLVGTSDFNDDAKTDLLWRHAASGENVIWLMNGVDLVSGTFTTPLPDTRWQIGGTGDFNRDGRPDILWRHAASGENVVWYMNGTALASGTFLTPSALPDTGWRIAGVADFDRDGKVDVLWHHQVSGQVVVWYMNGATLSSGTFTSPPALSDVRWQIAAVGDYDSNGTPDLVWHNDFSGQTVVWFMNGASLASGTFTNPSTFPDTNWKLVGPR